MEIQDRINLLMQNEAFAAEFAAVKSPEEVIKLFGRENIEVPMEIAEELFLPDVEEGELSESELDNVAGGGICAIIGKGVFYGAGYLGGRLAGWDKKSSKAYASKASKVGSVLGKAFDYALGV